MSVGSAKIRSLATVIYRYRIQSRTNLSHDHRQHNTFSLNNGFMFSSLIESNTAKGSRRTAKHIVMTDDKKIDKLTQPPVKRSFSSWVTWIMGSFLSIILPFWKQKWTDLLILAGTVEKVVEEVEVVAEVVEKVATTAEKLSAEVADEIPNNGILKEAALVIEHVSIEVAKDAKLAQDIIHKVDELEHDLTDLETVVKPIINKIIKKEDCKK